MALISKLSHVVCPKYISRTTGSSLNIALQRVFFFFFTLFNVIFIPFIFSFKSGRSIIDSTSPSAFNNKNCSNDNFSFAGAIEL